MRMPQHATYRKGIWHFLIKSCFHRILFFKGLRKKACEACPFMGYAYAVGLKMFSVYLISRQNFSIFVRKEEYYPHIHNGHPSAT